MVNQGWRPGGPLLAAVVSSSPLLRRRVVQGLDAARFKPVELSGWAKLVKSQRQRPFAVCFLDVRGPTGTKTAMKCFAARPGERFVLIRDGQSSGVPASERIREFGTISEAFTSVEIAGWADRAAVEELRSQSEPPLEDLLYERFRTFLNHLGPTPMNNLHELVWERVERPLFKAVLEWSDGNQTRASSLLGLHRNTLRAKLKALNLSE